MSAKPPLVIDNPCDPSTACWTEADAHWEVLQEQALSHAVAGRFDAAGNVWGEALFLARESFAGQDLRLATSLANLAFFIDRCGDKKAAAEKIGEALRIWDAGGVWLDTLKIERKARSSLFHLRLEVKNWQIYEATRRKQLSRYAREGRDAIAALAEGRSAGSSGMSRWQSEKSTKPTDSRKILAAALLVVRADEIGDL